MLPRLCCPCCATPLTLSLVMSSSSSISKAGASSKRARTATSASHVARSRVDNDDDDDEADVSAALSGDAQGGVGGRSAFELYCMHFASAQNARRGGRCGNAAVADGETRQALARRWLSADDAVRARYEEAAAAVGGGGGDGGGSRASSEARTREAAATRKSDSYHDVNVADALTAEVASEGRAARQKPSAGGARTSAQRGKAHSAAATMCAAAVSSRLTGFNLFRKEHCGVYEGMAGISRAWAALGPAGQQRYSERAAVMRTRACMMQRRQQRNRSVVMLTSSSHVDLAVANSGEAVKTCSQTAFYFVVFLHNCPHLFHSGRIPDVHQDDGEAQGGAADAATADEGSAVGEFRTLYGAMEEVPQQTLQSIAFPTVFGGSGGLPPMPRRPFTAATTTTTTAGQPPPWWCRSNNADEPSEARDGASGGAAHVPSRDAEERGEEGRGVRGVDVPEGPPWSMRLEEMNNARGVRQCYRVILTARLSALVSSRSAGSMQSRAAAVGLVIACPPHTAHYNFLINHFDCLRALLHRVMDFGLHALHRFFSTLLTMPAAPRPPQQQEVLKRVWSQLEQSAEARQTYDAVKDELRHALELALPLVAMQVAPRAMSTVGGVCGDRGRQLVCLSAAQPPHSTPAARAAGRVPGAPLCSVGADALYKSLVRLTAFSASYLTAVIAGVLALGEEARETGTSAAAIDRNMAGEVDGQRPAARQAAHDVASSPQAGQRGGATARAERGADKEGYVLSKRRKGRVVLFTRDDALAEHLMRVVAFFFACHDTSLTAPHHESNGAADGEADGGAAAPRSPLLPSACASTLVRHCYAWAIAAHTASALSANVPMQWVRAEYDDAAAARVVGELYSPYNAVLLLAPRSLLCRRVGLDKRLRSTTLLLEHLVVYNSNGNSRREVQLRSAPDHFRCDVCRDELVEADAVLGTLVTEALNLHRTSRGAIGCDVVLRRMADWRRAQQRASALAARVGGAQSPARPPSRLPCAAATDEGAAEEGRTPTSRVASWRSTFLSSPVRRAVTMPLAVRHGSRSASQLPETDEEQQQLLLPGSQRSRSGLSLLNAMGLLVSPKVFIGDDTRLFATSTSSSSAVRSSLPSSPARPASE